MKFGMYIMAPEPISATYLINSLPSVCVSVYPSCRCQATARQKCYHGNGYTRNNSRIFGPVVFYAVRVVLKEIRFLAPPTNCFYFEISYRIYYVTDIYAIEIALIYILPLTLGSYCSS
jgi:hypothetical protein